MRYSFLVNLRQKLSKSASTVHCGRYASLRRSTHFAVGIVFHGRINVCDTRDPWWRPLCSRGDRKSRNLYHSPIFNAPVGVIPCRGNPIDFAKVFSAGKDRMIGILYSLHHIMVKNV